MGLFDMFTKPAVDAAPAQSTPGNMPQQPSTPVQPGTGDVPATIPAATESNSPLDQFKDLWEINPNAKSDEPIPQLDQTKLQEAMGKADFSSVLTQENLSAISQGGEAAVKAFAASMNDVARNVMVQSTLISNKMIEQAVERATQAQNAKLPELMKKQALNENLSSSNPLFKNPAVKPVIEAVQSQLATKYPEASARELAEMAQNFVKAMGESFNPTPTAKSSQGEDGTDWSMFLEG